MRKGWKPWDVGVVCTYHLVNSAAQRQQKRKGLSQKIMDAQQISIKPFESEDQEAVRHLILAGLTEH